MLITEKRRPLIERLFVIVGACVERNNFISARLYQRDLILLMMQDSRYSKTQVGDAYFALAEFCAKVGDFKSVNKYVSRASEYKRIASKGKATGLGKFFEDGDMSQTKIEMIIDNEPGTSERTVSGAAQLMGSKPLLHR